MKSIMRPSYISEETWEMLREYVEYTRMATIYRERVYWSRHVPTAMFSYNSFSTMITESPKFNIPYTESI